MSDSLNPHRDPVARELHDANAQLHGIQEQLWESNQPVEVRLSLQQARAERAHGMLWLVRLAVGLLVVWFVLTKLFGTAGSNVVLGAVSLAWTAVQVALVFGVLVYLPYRAARRAWYGARKLVGRTEGER